MSKIFLIGIVWIFKKKKIEDFIKCYSEYLLLETKKYDNRIRLEFRIEGIISSSLILIVLNT